MNVSFRVILAAGASFAVFAGLVSHAFTLATGTALWTLEADPSASFSYVMLMNQVYWGTWALLTPAIFRVADRIPMTAAAWQRRLPVHVLAGSAFVFAHAALVGTGRAWLQAAYGMETVWTEWIRHQFLRTFDWELTYYAAAVGVRHALVLHQAARDREVRAAELETRLVEAQLQALQRQLHPHFLFNTLHAISALVRRDPAAAETMIERLGDLLRLTLNRFGWQEVTLAQELEYLDVYLEIEQLHFGDRLRVRRSIDAAARDALVPYLVLQPLVENAITHGLAPRLAPGVVTIEASIRHPEPGTVSRGTWNPEPGTRNQRPAQLLLRVADTGVGLQAGAASRARHGVGLSNTRARLEHLYGANHRFTLAQREGGGAVAEIEIPLRAAAEAAPGDAPEEAIA